MGWVDVAVPPRAGYVRIAASGSTSVADLKSKVAKATGYLPSDQHLLLDDEPLEEDASRLDHAGISNGDTLLMSVAKTSAPPALVWVALPRSMHAAFGPTLQVAAPPSDTIADFKAKLEAITEVPVKIQRVAFDGVSLNDEDKLSSSGFAEHGSPLSLSLTGLPPPPPLLITVAAPWLRPEAVPEVEETIAPKSTIVRERKVEAKAGALAKVKAVVRVLVRMKMSARVSAAESEPEEAEVAAERHTLRIATSAHASVGELKVAIHDATGYDPVDQDLRLLRDGVTLSDDAISLGMAGVAGGGTVHLNVVDPGVPPTLVRVALPRSMHAAFGPTLQVAAPLTDTVGAVKARLEAITGVPRRIMKSLALPASGGLGAKKPLGDDDELGVAGVPKQGGRLTLTLSEPPPPPPLLTTVTLAFVDVEEHLERRFATSSVEAAELEHLLQKHQEHIGPALTDKLNERLEHTQLADAAMRAAIENIMSRSPAFEADTHWRVLEAHKDTGSPSTARRLSTMLASLDVADASLRKALETDPLTKGLLRAALERHGGAASPILCKAVESRLQEFEEADAKVKATIQAIAERARLPTPPYEAQQHRDVLTEHGSKASRTLSQVLKLRLEAMDAADGALVQAMGTGGVEEVRGALLAHGLTSSPSLEVAAKAKLDELDPSGGASLQVKRTLKSTAQRRLRRRSMKRHSVEDARRVADVNYRVEDRWAGGQLGILRKHRSFVKRKDQIRDWNAVQSRWAAPTKKWQGAGSGRVDPVKVKSVAPKPVSLEEQAIHSSHPVGSRVVHNARGKGTVMEHMVDGRTRILFDSGAAHRYHPVSMTKVKVLTRPRSGIERAGSVKRRGSETLRSHYPLGGRVVHKVHGTGTVMEHMADGRTRVLFDTGAEHRYRSVSMYKLKHKLQAGVFEEHNEVTRGIDAVSERIQAGTSFSKRPRTASDDDAATKPLQLRQPEATMSVTRRVRKSIAGLFEQTQEVFRQSGFGST